MRDQRLSRNSDEIIGKILEGEAIIINLVSGAYYSTAGVGASIWEGIEEGCTIAGIVALLTARYDVDEDTARQDVERIVREMNDEKLLRMEETGETHAAPAAAAETPRAPYEPPVFSIYRDMSELLALDPPMPVFGETPRNWDPEPGT